MADDDRYDYGPPPLSDEEVARIEELFRYSEEAVMRCVAVLAWSGSSAADKEAAIVELERVRGERK